MTGNFDVPNEDSVIFMHVADEVKIGPVEFKNCWRLGSVPTDEGPLLMDAQACQITGPANVLIGSGEAGAVVLIADAGKRTFIVLDKAFLGRRAPKLNTEWLAKVISE